jgi:hypothetical protein
VDTYEILVPKTDPDRVKRIRSDSHPCAMYSMYSTYSFPLFGAEGRMVNFPSLFCEGKQGTFPLLCAVGVFYRQDIPEAEFLDELGQKFSPFVFTVTSTNGFTSLVLN